MKPFGRQFLSMGYGVGDKGCILCVNMFQHISGAGSGVQIDKIMRVNQRSSISGNLDLFCLVPVFFLGDGWLLGQIETVGGNGSAEYFGQTTFFIKQCNISSCRRFGDIKQFSQFGYSDTATLV